MDTLFFEVGCTETTVFIETSGYNVHVDTLHDSIMIRNKITGKHEVFSISLFNDNILEIVGKF